MSVDTSYTEFSPEANQMTKVGTKGSDVYTTAGVGDPRVALSALLVRNADKNLIQESLLKVLSMDDDKALEDAFVLTFQTRDVRGGKGERDLSNYLWQTLLLQIQTRGLALDLLDLVPEFGSWRDMFVLADGLGARERIMDLTVAQFLKDEKAVAEGKSASLLAKWIPREDRDKALAREIAQRLNPTETQAPRLWAAYRKRVSALNKTIKTVEVPMCAKQWATIEPARVPGRANQLYAKAFLNEAAPKRKGQRVPAGALRHPDDEDRMACRAHFQAHFSKAARGEAKVNGSRTVFPHELIKKIVKHNQKVERAENDYHYCCCLDSDDEYDAPTISDGEKNSMIAVWNQMVKDAKEGGGLGRSIAMCDFSGSMRGSGSNGDTPYWVSMAMGLLISEVTTAEFKDTFLTFDSTPKIHNLPKGDIFTRVASISDSLGQGTSTDFQKAMDLILARLKQTRCRPGQEPKNLIVLTDMNWDQACASNQRGHYTGNSYRHVVKTDPWQTHVEMIREAFKRAGEDMWGSETDGGLGGLTMPTIVIWNIASTSSDFHAQADTPGVVMLSGWSPNLFKVLQTKGVVSWTPYQALRAQLDDERYDEIRKRFRDWKTSAKAIVYDC